MNYRFKNQWPIYLYSLLAVPVLAASARAQFAKGSFETGNFSSWKLELPRVISTHRSGKILVGTAPLISVSTQLAFPTFSRTFMGGSYFAALRALDRGNFSGRRTFSLTLSQQLCLDEHDTLSGWASFYNGDYEPHYCARVKLFDPTGHEFANPWRECSSLLSGGDSNSAPYLSATPWSYWQWEAPGDGLYTVSLGVTTSRNNNFADYGFFDAICVQASNPVVPEPSALALWVTGVLLLAGWRLRGS